MECPAYGNSSHTAEEGALDPIWSCGTGYEKHLGLCKKRRALAFGLLAFDVPWQERTNKNNILK